MDRRTFLKSIGAGTALSVACPSVSFAKGFVNEIPTPTIVSSIVPIQHLTNDQGMIFYLLTKYEQELVPEHDPEWRNISLSIDKICVDKTKIDRVNLYDLLIDQSVPYDPEEEFDNSNEAYELVSFKVAKINRRTTGDTIVAHKNNKHLMPTDNKFNIIYVDHSRYKNHSIVFSKPSAAVDSRIICVDDEKYVVAEDVESTYMLVNHQ